LKFKESEGLGMCGLVGFLSGDVALDQSRSMTTLVHMTDALFNRGPDDAGYWIDSDASICLGHRRLAIVDLSAAGHQPMASAAGRYVIVFNGEVYNHCELRKKLAAQAQGHAPAWRGQSDTETLLACFDAWGIRDTLKQMVGMFAFAVWDKSSRTLTLALDRLGEKPLYYGWQGRGSKRTFLFGSDLDAIRRHPAFEGVVDRNALTQLLRHNYIPAPHAIYEGISKLNPGCLLTLSLRDSVVRVETYWSCMEQYRRNINAPFQGTDEEAVDALEARLRKAVARQMMSDVPIGAFLSGGVDSSTVVALMQAESSQPVRTFAIGFHEPGYNEAAYAKAVAAHLGTSHTELYVTAADAISVIPRLASIYSEPFSDSSQIPTFLVSQLARRDVTVSLSGDAGDELFCGYGRYSKVAGIWDRLRHKPLSFRRFAARMATSLSVDSWNRVFGLLMPVLPVSLKLADVGDRMHSRAGFLGSESLNDVYVNISSHWTDPAAIVLGSREPLPTMKDIAVQAGDFDDMQRMMAIDMQLYLPGDILAKVDRAAMAVSLETRVPFLDHEVVEFAMSLPGELKLRNGTTKWILRQVLYRHVPAGLIERPKMGFGVPVHQWLRGPLRDWAESLLDESRLRKEGYFRPEPIVRCWKEHVTGKRNWQYPLWNVLMFQAWLERQKKVAG
jgi:asparagine synthase (glutamine-hydrolysing)